MKSFATAAAMILVVAGSASAATTYTRAAQITAASSPARIAATLKAKTTTPAMRAKILRVGKPTDVIEDYAFAPNSPIARSVARGKDVAVPIIGSRKGSGCAGIQVRTKKVYIFVAVVLAWKQVRIDGFCWNSRRITSVGKVTGLKDNATGYCWTNESLALNPHSGVKGRWWEYVAHNAGTLRITSKIGCGLVPYLDSRRLNAVKYMKRGGYVNNGT